MSDDRDAIERLVDAALDDALSAEERRRLDDDPAARDELARLQFIDGALRRLFEPPEVECLESLLPDPQRDAVAAAAHRRRWPRRLAAAAGIAAMVAGGWLMWTAVRPARNGAYVPPPWRSLETVYTDEAGGPFEPLWVCKDNAEFAATFTDRLGHPLVLGPLPEDVEAVGLSYCHSLSARTVYLLARVDGQPVLVFVDRDFVRSPPPPPAREGLHRWSRSIGRLVLYEVSPLPEPHLLDRFAATEADLPTEG